MRLPLLILALTLAAAAPAAAAPSMDVGISDDRILLNGSEADINTAVAEFQTLGVDVVRIHARWVGHAPAPHAQRMPGGFNGRDPSSAGYQWGHLDRAVRKVREKGMRVMLTVTGSGPVWGTLNPRRRNPRHMPSPTRFADFATAVARRYGDDVDQYVLWNEPNHELWLQPQNTCTRRGCTPYAPHLYRRIVRAAEPAIRAADPGARVMMGALAPRGTNGRSRNARLRPLAFLRAMGCVNARYRRVRSGACRGFTPAASYGFAYHPHGLKRSPSSRSAHRDEAQMGDLPRLVSALDRITRAGGLRSRGPRGRFPLYLDEWGYQTNRPDRVLGVPASSQARWLQQGAYIAWAHPRVRNLTQYGWRDEPLRRSDSAGWQSGLRYLNGSPKPALASFPDPFWAVRRSRGVVRLWGQIRPGGAQSVSIERRSGSRWVRIATVRTDSRGFLRRDVRSRGAATYRFRHAAGTSSARRA